MNATMTPGTRRSRWPLGFVLALGLLVLAAAIYHRTQSTDATTKSVAASTNQTDPAVMPHSGSPAIPPRAAVSTDRPEASKEKQREPIFEMWRSGILSKNAQQVLTVERSFLGNRARFHDGLVALAEKDPEERIRSFSTRVLGKFAMEADLDLFTRLLENDPSPYVRQNAAWALGELGKGASAQALRRISQDDPDTEVRTAAGNALTRIR